MFPSVAMVKEENAEIFWLKSEKDQGLYTKGKMSHSTGHSIRN